MRRCKKRRCTTNTRKLLQAIAEGEKRYQEFKTELEKREATAPQAGDGYCFNLGQKCSCLYWTLISRHPNDDGLWFLVPVDCMCTCLVGVYDVVVPLHEPGGESVVHANCGLWAKMHNINANGQRNWFIPDQYVTQTREKLARLARGQMPNDVKPEQEESEYNPDYYSWIHRINASRDTLARLLG